MSKCTLDVGCGERKKGDLGVDVRRLGSVDVIADAHHLPFVDASFSGCNALAVLEHVDDPLAVPREIHRVLKPKAPLHLLLPRRSRMCFYQAKLLALLRWRTCWNIHKSLRKGTRKWQFTPRGLRRVLTEAKFQVEGVSMLLDHKIPFTGNIIATARSLPE
jgi:ubiquinone/menaquinone biosynthesis C-methylase UbiE